MRYVILSLCVTICVLSIVVLKSRHIFNRSFVYTLLILLVLTAVFDSLIVGSGIVGYTRATILGIFIGKAPIEDFFYTVVAVMGSVSLWERYAKK